MNTFTFPGTEPRVGSFVVNHGSICQIVELLPDGWLKARTLNWTGRRYLGGFCMIHQQYSVVVQTSAPITMPLYRAIIGAPEVKWAIARQKAAARNQEVAR